MSTSNGHWAEITRFLLTENIPFLPTSDRVLLSAVAIGKLTCTDARTSRVWIKKTGCRVVQPGQTQFVDTDELAALCVRGGVK